MTTTCPAAVTVTVAGSVATVAVGDGRRRNALDTAGWDALRHSVAGLPNELQAVVVHGAGPRSAQLGQPIGDGRRSDEHCAARKPCA